MDNKRAIKVIKKADAPKQQHPFYQAFTYQLSAALAQARAIRDDLKADAPPVVQRFLDEFDKKVA